jgi:hypothetical protein
MESFFFIIKKGVLVVKNNSTFCGGFPTSIVVNISFLKINLNSSFGLKGYDFVVKGKIILFGTTEIKNDINYLF